jgi:nitroreductase
LLGRSTRKCSVKAATPSSFELLCNSRKSEYNFASRPIDESIIKNILLTTQTAPSSFNLQPYKIIMVQSELVRSAIADNAMLGYSNSSRVKTAPLTAVFLSDKIPSELIKKVMKLELENGTDPTYVSSLPAKVLLIHSQ